MPSGSSASAHDADAAVLALLPPPDHVGSANMPDAMGGGPTLMAQLADDVNGNPDDGHH